MKLTFVPSLFRIEVYSLLLITIIIFIHLSTLNTLIVIIIKLFIGIYKVLTKNDIENSGNRLTRVTLLPLFL